MTTPDSESRSILSNIVKKIVPPAKDPTSMVQTFETEPTDAELSDFVDFGGRNSLLLKITDNLAGITAKPRKVPLWIFVLCACLPVAITIWVSVKDGASESGSVFGMVLKVVIMALVFYLFAFICYKLNDAAASRGDYFHFDSVAGVLHLPRSEITLSGEQVCSFFELCSYRTLSTGTTSSSQWASELSVLAKADDDRICRYPVVIDGNDKKIHGIATQLAASFDVPLRSIKMDTKTRKALGVDP